MRSIVGRLSGLLKGLFRAIDAYAMGYDVFVSYAWYDGRPYAVSLVKALQEKGFRCFLDSSEFKAGSDLNRDARRAVKTSNSAAIVVTPAAVLSQHVRKEICLFDQSDKPLVPIDIKETLYQSRVKTDGSVQWNSSVTVQEILEKSKTKEEADEIQEALNRISRDSKIQIVEVNSEQPSDETIDALCQRFRFTRRVTRRLRLISLVCIALVALSVTSLWLVDARNVANKLLDSERKLALKDVGDAYWQRGATARDFELDMRKASVMFAHSASNYTQAGYPGKARQAMIASHLGVSSTIVEDDPIRDIQVDVSEQLTAVQRQEGGWSIWDTQTHQRLSQVGLGAKYENALLCSGGDYFVTLVGKQFQLFSTNTGELVKSRALDPNAKTLDEHMTLIRWNQDPDTSMSILHEAGEGLVVCQEYPKRSRFGGSDSPAMTAIWIWNYAEDSLTRILCKEEPEDFTTDHDHSRVFIMFEGRALCIDLSTFRFDEYKLESVEAEEDSSMFGRPHPRIALSKKTTTVAVWLGNKVAVWEPFGAAGEKPLPGTSTIQHVALNESADMIAVSRDDGHTRVWGIGPDVGARFQSAPALEIEWTGRFGTCQFNDRYDELLICSHDNSTEEVRPSGIVQWWSIEKKKRISAFRSSPESIYVSFGRTGDTIGSAKETWDLTLPRLQFLVTHQSDDRLYLPTLAAKPTELFKQISWVVPGNRPFQHKMPHEHFLRSPILQRTLLNSSVSAATFVPKTDKVCLQLKDGKVIFEDLSVLNVEDDDMPRPADHWQAPTEEFRQLLQAEKLEIGILAGMVIDHGVACALSSNKGIGRLHTTEGKLVARFPHHELASAIQKKESLGNDWPTLENAPPGDASLTFGGFGTQRPYCHFFQLRDSGKYFSLDQNGTGIVWQLSKHGVAPEAVRSFSCGVQSHPIADGKWILAHSFSGALQLLDPNDASRDDSAPFPTVEVPNSNGLAPTGSVTTSADGSMIAFLVSGRIFVYEIESRKKVFTTYDRDFVSVEFGWGAKKVVAVGIEQIEVFDIGSGNLDRSFETDGSTSVSTFGDSFGNRFLISYSNFDGLIHLFELSKESYITKVFHPNVRSVSAVGNYPPDSSWQNRKLLINREEGLVSIWTPPDSLQAGSITIVSESPQEIRWWQLPNADGVRNEVQVRVDCGAEVDNNGEYRDVSYADWLKAKDRISDSVNN